MYAYVYISPLWNLESPRREDIENGLNWLTLDMLMKDSYIKLFEIERSILMVGNTIS